MPQTRTQTPTGEPDFKNLHILIVDDDAPMLDLIEALLQSIGVGHVSRAGSGVDAFGKLSNPDRVVDCVLCDYTMANGNGLQLLQAIRMGQIKFFRADACFVLLTASSDPTTVAMAMELDVNGYLVKPVTPDKLRVSISKARARSFRLNFQKYSQVVVPA